MADIEQIGRTAFLISELRAEEPARAPPLFDDPYARLFSSPGSQEALKRAHQLGPLFAAALRVRIRWFDDVVRRELDAGARQVLLLGAGMDCRALRFARPGVRWFEVDSPGVLAFKAQRLAAAAHAAGAVAVGADYLAPGLVERLVASGLDPALRTLVLWEGNVCYLEPAQARALLGTLDAALPDVRVAFDYFGTAVIEGRSRVPPLNQAVALFQRLGVPWRCGIDDLPAWAAAARLRVAEVVSTGELLRRYLPGDDLRAGEASEVWMALLAR